MNSRIMARTLACTVVVFSVSCGGTQQRETAAEATLEPGQELVRRTAEGMVGRWVSIEGEVRPNTQGGQDYLKRDFTNKPDFASATLIFYQDDTYTDKNITVVVDGPYELVRPSPVVEGAVEGDFSFTVMKLTPHSPGMVGFLSSAEPGTCGDAPWELDVEQDVSSTDGCSVFGVQLSTYREYDLLKVDNDQLFYGARPADGTPPDRPEKRPTSLQPPLRRAS